MTAATAVAFASFAGRPPRAQSAADGTPRLTDLGNDLVLIEGVGANGAVIIRGFLDADKVASLNAEIAPPVTLAWSWIARRMSVTLRDA